SGIDALPLEKHNLMVASLCTPVYNYCIYFDGPSRSRRPAGEAKGRVVRRYGSGICAEANGMKVGIVGTSGYSGAELLRLLFAHPEAEVEYVASTSKVGQKVGDVLPALDRMYDLTFEPVDASAIGARCDVVFTA